MTSNFSQKMVNQDQEIIFEVVKVSGSWVFPAASSIVEATKGKNMYLRLTDDGKSDIFRLDYVKDGESAGETVFGFVGNGGMDLVELTATTDGNGTTTGSWEYEPGAGPAGEAIGNSGKIAVFECTYSQEAQGYVYPVYGELNAARVAGKLPVIVEISPVGGRIYYVATQMSSYQYNVKFHFVDSETGAMLKLEGPTSNPVWSTYQQPVSRMPAQLFVEPPVLGGAMIPNGNSSFYLSNVVDGFSLALIGLTASDGSYVSAGDIFELVMNGCPAFGNSNLSMGLFKMVGHPTAGTSMSGPVTFRRLTASLPPRSIAGVRNDGGVPPYGQEPVAANPIRFTLDQSAQFDKGEPLYLGIALAYDSTQDPSFPVFICAAQQLPVKDDNNPINVVGPVYYATGQSDKIGADGFTAREFTIGYSDADFFYASTFASGLNAYEISSGGVAEIQTKTYPSGFKLMKQ